MQSIITFGRRSSVVGRRSVALTLALTLSLTLSLTSSFGFGDTAVGDIVVGDIVVFSSSSIVVIVSTEKRMG